MFTTANSEKFNLEIYSEFYRLITEIYWNRDEYAKTIISNLKLKFQLFLMNLTRISRENFSKDLNAFAENEFIMIDESSDTSQLMQKTAELQQIFRNFSDEDQENFKNNSKALLKKLNEIDVLIEKESKEENVKKEKDIYKHLESVMKITPEIFQDITLKSEAINIYNIINDFYAIKNINEFTPQKKAVLVHKYNNFLSRIQNYAIKLKELNFSESAFAYFSLGINFIFLMPRTFLENIHLEFSHQFLKKSLGFLKADRAIKENNIYMDSIIQLVFLNRETRQNYINLNYNGVIKNSIKALNIYKNMPKILSDYSDQLQWHAKMIVNSYLYQTEKYLQENNITMACVHLEGALICFNQFIEDMDDFSIESATKIANIIIKVFCFVNEDNKDIFSNALNFTNLLFNAILNFDKPSARYTYPQLGINLVHTFIVNTLHSANFPEYKIFINDLYFYLAVSLRIYVEDNLDNEEFNEEHFRSYEKFNFLRISRIILKDIHKNKYYYINNELGLAENATENFTNSAAQEYVYLEIPELEVIDQLVSTANVIPNRNNISLTITLPNHLSVFKNDNTVSKSSENKNDDSKNHTP